MHRSADGNLAELPIEALQDFARRQRLRELAIGGFSAPVDGEVDARIDVFFELDRGESMSIERYIEMEDDLEAILRQKVHLVEMPLVRNPHDRAHILRTRKVVYAA